MFVITTYATIYNGLKSTNQYSKYAENKRLPSANIMPLKALKTKFMMSKFASFKPCYAQSIDAINVTVDAMEKSRCRCSSPIIKWIGFEEKESN